MADILSQDEIDRLLSATAFDAAPEVQDMSATEMEGAEKLVRVFFASANSTLATLLARPASVTDGLGQVVDVADLDTTGSILLRFPFRSGFSGEMWFLLRQNDAAILADLILGGDGNGKEDLEDADLDALKEAMAQVSGSGAPTLSATLGTEVGFAPPSVEMIAQGALNAALGQTQVFLGAGTIKVDGVSESPLRILLAIDLARELAQAAGKDEEEVPTSSSTVIPTAYPGPTPQPISGTPNPQTFAPPPDIRNIDLILDIEVEVMVRLGEAQMSLREIQQLRPGSIINLDKDTDALVELVVNDKVIAKGELVVVGSDHFALRITEIETPSERIRTLGS